MTSATPLRVLLGPQTPTRNVAEAVASANLPDGELAIISAGWQEAENDLDELQEVVGRPLEDLRLYARAEDVFAADRHLKERYRSRQDLLKDQQRLYGLRLKQLAIAARQTMSAGGDPDMLLAEQRHAIAQLRALDRHHLHRTNSIHKQFEAVFDVASSRLLTNHVNELRAIVARCSAVLITGGNIVVLLNRMRLFGVGELLQGRNIIAWSAGAMVLAERIVLFHERMPQRRRESEILGAGFGLVPGYVFLPDATRRLREQDRLRVGLMCRRFSPDVCAALDSGAAMHFADDHLISADAVRRLNRDGRFVRLRPA
jgi:hypothetical protein